MKKFWLIIPLAFSMSLGACVSSRPVSEDHTPTSSATSSADPTSTPTGTTSPTQTTTTTTTTTTPTSSQDTPTVNSVSVSPKSKTLDLNTTEKTVQLVATVNVSGGASQAVTWSVDGSGVTVSNSGLVTATAVTSTPAKVYATSTVDPLKKDYAEITVINSHNPATDHVAQVKFGENDYVSLTAMSTPPEGDGGLYQFEGTFNVHAGDAITFAFDHSNVNAGDGNSQGEPHNGNNTYGEYPNYVVHNDASSAKVYFKVYETGYSFWLTGYDENQPDPVPAETTHWYFVGTPNEWLPTTEMSKDDGFPTETVEYQYSVTVELLENDEFKFMLPIGDNSALYLGYDNLENPELGGLHRKAYNDDNIVVDYPGSYSFYLKKLFTPDQGRDFLIYVAYPEGFTPEVPLTEFAYYYSATATEWGTLPLVENTSNPGEYMFDGGHNFEVGDKIKLHVNDHDYGFTKVKYESPEYDVDFKQAAENDDIEFAVAGLYDVYIQDGAIYIARRLIAKYACTLKVNEKFDYEKLTVTYLGKKIKKDAFELSCEGSIIDSNSSFVNRGTYIIQVSYELTGAIYTTTFKIVVVDDESYTLKIADNAPILMSELTGPFEEDPLMRKRYVVNDVNLKKDDKLVFYVNDEPIPSGIDASYGNIAATNGELIVKKGNPYADVYLNVYDFYYTFSSQEDQRFFVVSDLTDWAKDESFVTISEPDPSYQEQYSFVWNNMPEDTEFKFYTDRPDWGGNGYLGGELEDNPNFKVLENGNIRCLKDGNYKLYLKIYGWNQWSIYIQNLDEEQTDTLEASYDGSLVINEKIDLTKIFITFNGNPVDISDVTLTHDDQTVDENTSFANPGNYVITVTYVHEGTPYVTTFTIEVSAQRHFYAKINTGEPQQMSKMVGPFDDPNMKEQYCLLNVSVQPGDTVAFSLNEEAIATGDDRDVGNLHIEEGVITFLKNNPSCDIYLKVYEGGYDFYASFDQRFFIAGTDSSWAKSESFVMTSEPDEHYDEQYSFLYENMAEGTEFKIYSDRDNFGNNGYEGGDNGILEPNDNFSVLDSGNIKCLTTGNYKIFFKINHDRSHSIYIQNLDEPQHLNELIISFTGTLYVGQQLDLAKLSVTYYDGVGESHNVPLNDEKLSFFVDDVEQDITTYVFSTNGHHKLSAKYEYEATKFIEGEITITAKEDPNTSVLLYVIITGDNIVDWYENESAKFFVWAWDEGQDGRLIEASDYGVFDPADKNHIWLEFEVNPMADYCIALRCDPSAVAGTQWPENKVWNNSGNLNIAYDDVGYYAAYGNW